MILFSVEKKIAVDKIIWEGLSSSEIHTALHVVQLALLMKAKIFNDISQVCVSLIHLNFLYFFPIYSRQVRRLIIKKKAWKVKKSKTITINQHHDKQWKSKLSHHLPPFQAVSLLLFFFLFCFPKKKPRKHCMNAYVVYPHNFIITSPIVKRKKKGGGRH